MKKNKKLNVILAISLAGSALFAGLSLLSSNSIDVPTTSKIADASPVFLNHNQVSNRNDFVPGIANKYPSQISNAELQEYIHYRRYDLLKDKGVTEQKDADVIKADVIWLDDSKGQLKVVIKYKFRSPPSEEKWAGLEFTTGTGTGPNKNPITNTKLTPAVVDRLFNTTDGVYRKRTTEDTPTGLSDIYKLTSCWQSNNLSITAAVLEGYTEISNNAFSSTNKTTQTTTPTIQTGLTEITFPGSITKLGDNIFKGTSITQLSIPSTIKNIGKKAFNGMSNLTKITFENNFNSTVEGTSTNDTLFNGCTSLQEVVFPLTMKSNISNLFDTSNTALTKITASYDDYYPTEKHNWGQISTISFTWLGVEVSARNDAILGQVPYVIKNTQIKDYDITSLTNEQIINIIIKENLVKGFPKYYSSSTPSTIPTDWVSKSETEKPNKYNGTLTLNIKMKESFITDTATKKIELKQQELNIASIKLSGFNKKFDQVTMKTQITSEIENMEPAEKYYLELKSNPPIIDSKLRTFIWNNIVNDPGTNPIKLNENMISKIESSSFDNKTGTLTISSVTLSKSYTTTAEVQNYKYDVNIPIKGFLPVENKTVVANTINSTTIPTLNGKKAEEVTTNDLKVAVVKAVSNPFNKDILLDGDYTIIENTIKRDTVGGKIDFKFTVNKNQIVEEVDGKFITNQQPKTYSLTLTDFVPVYVETGTKAPSKNFNTDKIAEDYYKDLKKSPQEIDDKLRTYIWNEGFTNPSGAGYTDLDKSVIKSIELADNAYDNKEGTLTIRSVTLSKWYETTGLKDSTSTSTPQLQPKKFDWQHTIKGFKKVTHSSTLPPSGKEIDISDYLTSIDKNFDDLTHSDYKEIIMQFMSNTYRPLTFDDITILGEVSTRNTRNSKKLPTKTIEYSIGAGLLYDPTDFSLNDKAHVGTMILTGVKYVPNSILMSDQTELVPAIAGTAGAAGTIILGTLAAVGISKRRI